MNSPCHRLCIFSLLVSTTVCGLAGKAIASTRNITPQNADASATVATEDESADTLQHGLGMADVIALLHQQQRELAAQKQLLQDQSQRITALTAELNTLKARPPGGHQVTTRQPLNRQEDLLVNQAPQTATPDLTGLHSVPPNEGQPAAQKESQHDTATAAQGTPATHPADQPQQSGKTTNEFAKVQADDPTRALMDELKGAWRLPGTTAALRIGGFVKTAIVINEDALQISDRFIVGSIPVGVNETTGNEAQTSVTADQSRLNFDLRQPSEYGTFRAFIEGDFAGSNETFRLRHAFGQWRRVITGKTWSTFMDPDASPEEIDFEGLNGRINKRHAQVRVMPTFGEKYELQLALEDPDPEVQNGSGISRIPDLVLAGRFYAYKRLHTKLALIARDIRAQSELGDVENEFAWGVSLSGSFATPLFDDRDKLLFQVNYGNGIGSYVNDLSSVGKFDGYFEKDTDNLELFDVTAGYVSWQHWWGLNDLRSNFTFGAVEVDNPDFVASDAYKETLRLSGNLIWSPMSRIDLGAEYLWGRRENLDGEDGDATQIQVMAKYRF
ncbi:MAG: porin [Halioglobus sp.]|nr:porin [Halioglobus sp.]